MAASKRQRFGDFNIGESNGQQRVAVVDPQGRLQSIPVDQLANAQAAGWNTDAGAIAEKLAAQETAKAHDTAGGQALAAVEGFAAGQQDLAFALPKAGLRLAGAVGVPGADDAAQALGGRQQVERAVGTVTGSPEAYAAAARARATANPFTSGASSALPGVVGAIGSAPFIGPGAAAIGFGAVEGALTTASQADEEAYLRGQYGATAESYFANGGLGLLLGGAGSALGEGLGLVWRKGSGLFKRGGKVTSGEVRAALEASNGGAPVSNEQVELLTLKINHTPGTQSFGNELFDAAAKRIADGDMSPLRGVNPGRLDDISAAITGADPEHIRKFAPWNVLDDAGQSRVTRAMQADTYLETNKRAIRDATKALQDVDEVLDEAVVHRADNIGSLLDPAQAETQLFETANMLRSMRRQVDEFYPVLRGKKALTELDDFRTYLDDQLERLAGADQKTVHAVAYELKQDLQRRVASFRGGQLTGRNKRELNALHGFFGSDLEVPLRTFTESEEVWGKAGPAVRNVNERWHDMLQTSDAFNEQFTREMESRYLRDRAGSRRVRQVTSDKIEPLVNDIGSARNVDRESLFRGHMQKRLALAESMVENYPMSPEMAGRVQRAAEAMRGIIRNLDEAAETSKLRDEFKALSDAGKAGGFGTSGAIVGSFFGGPIGAGLGAVAANAIANPAGSARMLVRLNTLLENNKSTVAKALKQYLFGAKRGGSEVTAEVSRRVSRTEAGRVGERAPGRSAPAGASDTTSGVYPIARKRRGFAAAGGAAASLVPFGSDRKERQREYRVAADRIASLTGNQESRVRAIGAIIDSMANDAPQTAAAAAVTANRAVDYLYSILPAGVSGDGLTPHLNRFEASDAEISRWGLAYQTIQNPLSVFDDLRRGTLTYEQVDALKAVYPEMHAQIQTAAVELLTQRTEPVPYNKALMLDLLCDLRGAGHPSLGPQFLANVQALSAQQPAAQPRPSSRKPEISNLHSTDPAPELS